MTQPHPDSFSATTNAAAADAERRGAPPTLPWDGAAASTTPEQARRRPRIPQWATIFLVGLALWAATVVVTFFTGNSNLIPTIILIGSFLVPVTFVSFAFSRADDVLHPQLIFTTFVVGGVLGVLGASVLEATFLNSASGPSWVVVGLIEEGVKLAALWLLALRLPRYTVRDGMVMGATVGLGFAALESAGYAFNALFTSQNLSLSNLIETEVLRGILTPLGHGLWTAILGGALFATARATGRLRLTPAVFGWYVVVVLLHAFWDASQTIALWITLVLTGGPIVVMTPQGTAPGLTQGQVHLYTGLSWTLMLLDGAIGVLILLNHWRAAQRSSISA